MIVSFYQVYYDMRLGACPLFKTLVCSLCGLVGDRIGAHTMVFVDGKKVNSFCCFSPLHLKHYVWRNCDLCRGHIRGTGEFTLSEKIWKLILRCKGPRTRHLYCKRSAWGWPRCIHNQAKESSGSWRGSQTHWTRPRPSQDCLLHGTR